MLLLATGGIMPTKHCQWLNDTLIGALRSLMPILLVDGRCAAYGLYVPIGGVSFGRELRPGTFVRVR
jgi:hypothetical protein